MSACTANVAGQDYADFIYRHSSATLEELSQTLHTDCISFVNESFAVYYVPLEEAMPLSLLDTYLQPATYPQKKI